MSSRSARAVSALVFLAGVVMGPAARPQDQTWYDLGGSFVSSGDHWGRSVAMLPDLDNDGYGEMLIGAPQDLGVGSAYLISGKAPQHLLKKQHHGFEADSTFGQTVAYAGNVNLDFTGDYLVAAPREDALIGFQLFPEGGVVRLYSGATGSVLHTFKGMATNARFGDALAGNADVTGDGRPDVLIGAPHWDKPIGGSNHGYVDLYDGATGALVHRHEGGPSGGLFGWSVAFIGDVNDDGLSEYAVGAPGWDTGSWPNIEEDVGHFIIYDGQSHTAINWWTGSSAGKELGWSVGAAGDTDDDGDPEMLIGAPGYQDGDGLAHVHEGLWNGYMATLEGPNDGNGTGVNDRFGSWVANVGDLDKDGHNEIAVSATQEGGTGGGFIRIFDGSDFSEMKLINYPAGSGAGYHSSFDGGRDVNGDGWPDLLVGLPNSDALASNAGGAECTGLLHYQPDMGFAGPHVAKFSIYGGELESGSLADLSLVNGPINGSGFLLLSPGFSVQPFKGGTLIPKLAGSFLVSFPVLPGGELTFPIPGGNGPLTVYGQFILSGYSSGGSFGLSNALIIQLQP